MKVGIAGGGIGGLSAAIALRRRGIDAIVFERASEPKALGAGLHLWTNAVRALREIGLGDQVDGVSVPIEYERMHAADGTRLVEWPVGQASREIGIPSIGLSRPALLRTLLEATADEALRLGSRVEGYEQHVGGVNVRLAGGEVESCDVLVGADGARSTVRVQLGRLDEPRYLGYTTWRTLIPPDRHDVPPGLLHQYWGRGVRFIFFPAAPDGTLYLVCLAKAPPGGVDAQGEAKERLRAYAKQFAEPIPALVEACDGPKLIRSDILDRGPIRKWGEGRITLLGDAAHAMAPNVSQGAGMAIEDAAVLARCLSEAGSPVQGLRNYERRRWKRAALMVELSRSPGTLGLVSRPRAVRVRDAYIRVAFGAPSWTMQRRLMAATY